MAGTNTRSNGMGNQGQEIVMGYPSNWESNKDIGKKTQRTNDDEDESRDFALLWICCCLTGMIMLPIGLLVLLTVLLPHNTTRPFKFEVISLDVASMNISNNQSSGIHKNMSADLNLTVNFMNNKQELLIEPLLVSIKYGHEFTSSVKIDPFYAVSELHKTIKLDMSIDASQLNDVIVDSLTKDLANEHALELILIIQGKYWRLDDGDNKFEYGVGITCEAVKIKFLLASNLTTGSMSDSPRSCKHTLIHEISS